eukprot:COSAG01_NODE_1321_length_10740_cov_4.850860_4_plen_83_part_00
MCIAVQPTDGLLHMITQHACANFEARKLIAQVVSHMLRKYQPTVDYVHTHPAALRCLVRGHQNSEIALTCGSMLVRTPTRFM